MSVKLFLLSWTLDQNKACTTNLHLNTLYGCGWDRAGRTNSTNAFEHISGSSWFETPKNCSQANYCLQANAISALHVYRPGWSIVELFPKIWWQHVLKLVQHRHCPVSCSKLGVHLHLLGVYLEHACTRMHSHTYIIWYCFASIHLKMHSMYVCLYAHSYAY